METTLTSLEQKIRDLSKEHGIPKYYSRRYTSTFPNYLDLYTLPYLLKNHIKSFTGNALNFYWHEPNSNTPSSEMELDSVVRGVPIGTDLFTVKIHYKDGTYDAYTRVIIDDDHR
jgi:hypothetical protein